MDIFKSANIKQAMAWDWNAKSVCKRHKGDTKKLHKISRNFIKSIDKKIIKWYN